MAIGDRGWGPRERDTVSMTGGISEAGSAGQSVGAGFQMQMLPFNHFPVYYVKYIISLVVYLGLLGPCLDKE